MFSTMLAAADIYFEELDRIGEVPCCSARVVQYNSMDRGSFIEYHFEIYRYSFMRTIQPAFAIDNNKIAKLLIRFSKVTQPPTELLRTTTTTGGVITTQTVAAAKGSGIITLVPFTQAEKLVCDIKGYQRYGEE